MDPSVMFIFASVVVGLAFTKSGLTKRLAYKMLQVVGEKTNMIFLGALVVTAGLAHVMAHTAAAATVFPILLAVNSLYGEGDKPTKFGKSLFIGMAYAAGAGSVITFPWVLPVLQQVPVCLLNLPARQSAFSNLQNSRFLSDGSWSS